MDEKKFETRIVWNKLDSLKWSYPTEQGIYLICDGYGNISKAWFTPDGKNLVSAIADNNPIVWEDNMEDLTDRELIELMRDYYVWYEWREEYSDNGREDILVIHRDQPTFWTNLNIEGPCTKYVDLSETTE